MSVKTLYSLRGNEPVKRDRLIVMVMGENKRPAVIQSVDPVNYLHASARYLSQILDIREEDLVGGRVLSLPPRAQSA
jgi:hypothetical protein